MRRSMMATTAGHLFQFIREGSATTRPELVKQTGLSRTPIIQRVEELIAAGLVIEQEPQGSTGGRPASRLVFNSGGGVILAADFGVLHCRVAVSNLKGTILTELAAEKPIALGPDVVLEWLVERFADLLAEASRGVKDVRGIGIGLPGPVEFSAGRAVTPPIMPGWDGIDVAGRLSQQFHVPVLVDNDVNIMAIGEYQAYWQDQTDDLLYIKMGTGIGCGIIAGGNLHRGANGAAGDIGHIQVEGHGDLHCHCGNYGCVEAVVGGEALSRQLTELGYDCVDTRGVVRLVRGGNADAARLVRRGGRAIGQVLAGLVNAFNPAVIVVGGDLAEAHTHLLAGIRDVIYQRSTALATRDLELVLGCLGDRAGAVGASMMVLDHILAPDAIDASIAALRSQAV